MRDLTTLVLLVLCLLMLVTACAPPPPQYSTGTATEMHVSGDLPNSIETYKFVEGENRLVCVVVREVSFYGNGLGVSCVPLSQAVVIE